MKTRNCLSSLALMATVALSGCTNDSDTPDTNPNFPQDGVMRFATSVTDAQTRTGYDDSNVTTQDLYLWVKPTGDNVKDAYIYKNILLHYANGGWGTYDKNSETGSTTSTTLLWQDKTTPVTVVASNFGEDNTGADLNTKAAIMVQSGQTMEEFVTTSDYLYFHGTVNPAATTDKTESDGSISQYTLVDGKVRLPLRHINSKLNIILTLGTEFNATTDGLGFGKANPLTDVKVNNVYCDCLFDMTTGTFGSFKDYEDKEAILCNITLSTGTDGSDDYHSLGKWIPAADVTKKATASYECILIPQTATFSVSFTLGGKAYKWTSASPVNFESGKAYTLELTAGKSLVTLQSKSITTSEWGSGTPENNGNIETE